MRFMHFTLGETKCYMEEFQHKSDLWQGKQTNKKQMKGGQIKWKKYRDTCTQQILDCLSRRHNEMNDQAVYIYTG